MHILHRILINYSKVSAYFEIPITFSMLKQTMFSNIKFTQIIFLLLICIYPLLSSYNFKSQHPSTESLAEPGFSPEMDKLLNQYGSMHTMREYIYWAVTEENISINLRNKLKHALLEKALFRRFFRQGGIFTYPRCINLVRILLNDLSGTKIRTNIILKLRHNKKYGLWADSRDMYLSISGFLTFQKMYLWPPARILQDLSISTSYQANLTEKQTSLIGMCGLYKTMYTFAVEWFEASEYITREKFELDTQQKHAFLGNDIITQIRDVSIQEHNRMSGRFECWINYECYMYLFTVPISYINEKVSSTRLTRREKMLPENSGLGTVGVPEDQLINLCSGSKENILPARMQVNLKCYYEKARHPYLHIRPVKTEQLSESPLIFQYYDLLGPKLIEELKDHYMENADIPSLVKSMQHYNRKLIYERTDPVPGYIVNIGEKYNGHPIFTKLAEMGTGIKFDGPAERIEFLDYTPGRGIRAHEDVERALLSDLRKLIDGNGFADLLYYLELPTLGGYTPFCQAGVRAQLSIGSLVIWINKYRNGTNRNDVFHGACPVVCGHKMILAQRIQYIGQENHFKCTLNQFE